LLPKEVEHWDFFKKEDQGKICFVIDYFFKGVSQDGVSIEFFKEPSKGLRPLQKRDIIEMLFRHYSELGGGSEVIEKK
jgi:hypothetical protein